LAGSGQIRQLKRRIRSVQSTQKITRAMEMIAASRILRAQARVRAARPYAEQVTRSSRGWRSPTRCASTRCSPSASPRGVAVIVNTSDRGLAGAYNANVLKVAERTIRDEEAAGARSTCT
jgi:F-type H+-transporting ATPase subunit gamma